MLEQATKDAKALALVDAHKVEQIKKIDNVKTEMELDADDEKEMDELAELAPTSRPMAPSSC